jgi:P-type Cu2+ transporter
VAGACSHCELPLRGRPVVARVAGEERRFCCAGCLLAFQVTRASGEPGAAAALVIRLGLAVFFAMNAMMLSLPTYGPDVYGGAADGPLFVVLRVLALGFAAPVLVLLGWPILAGALAGLRAGAANADALIVAGTAAAYGLSVVNLVHGRPGIYADTASMLLVLVTLGRYLEARARADAGAAVRATLAPAPARATRIAAGVVEAVPPEALGVGDEVRVGPGDAFPTDGVVVDGAGGVDEAALTGESRPSLKEPGAAVAGGTCSIDGLFRVRVTAPAAASAAARIAALLEAARRERAPIERAADRVARVMVPAVAAIALGAGLGWGLAAGADRGVLVALAVLVVACPCALGIATPAALWVGVAAAARRGIVLRSAPALERAARVDRVLFDKTGTLTRRVPRLVGIDAAAGVGEAGLLARAAAVERDLTHPLARAVVAAARARRVPVPDATAVRVVPGRGVSGVVDGEPVVAGSARFAAEALGRDPVPAEGADGVGRIVVVAAGRLLGVLRFVEAPRRGARRAVRALRAAGLRVGLVSGDTQAAAVVPAMIPPQDAFLGLLPEEKVARVRVWRREGTVLVVGDGLNDAPALAAADLGIAVASATDLARLSADAVVLGSDLGDVAWLLGHARRVMRVVRQNLLWAFAYNAIAVALAAAGALSPLVAALAMIASSGTVVANARRLRSDPGMPRARESARTSPPAGARAALAPAAARVDV